MLKYALNIFPPLAVMHQKTFVCLCRRTVSLIHTIFNTVQAISDKNNVYLFKDI